MRVVKYIVIHCTGGPQGQSVESIKNYWKNSLGWKNVGYHRLIEANGTIHNLADFNSVTNGVKGYNSECIHISYVGGQHGTDNRTEAQKAAIMDCIREALNWIGKKVIIQGHRDFPNVAKDCPSFNALDEYAWINV